MALAKDMVDLIDERIAAHAKAATATGSVVKRTTATTALVTFDGSAQATPVKCFGDVNIGEGDRVGMVRLGVDWTITGTFSRRRSITMPDGATTGTQRGVFGATTPPELLAYGLTVAEIFYVTSNVTGVEVGYFFIAVSNSMDNGAQYRALVFGNVTYPVAGDPTSATVANVKTNLQQDMWSQYSATIFKDHDVELFPGISVQIDQGDLRVQNGDVRFGGRVGHGRGLIERVDSVSGSSGIGAEAVVLTSPSMTFVNGRAYSVKHAAETAGSVANMPVTYFVRRTNLAGAQKNLAAFTTSPAVGTTVHCSSEFYVKNVSGADITDNLVLTLSGSGGNASEFGSSLAVRYLEIRDAGVSASFANAIQV